MPRGKVWAKKLDFLYAEIDIPASFFRLAKAEDEAFEYAGRMDAESCGLISAHDDRPIFQFVYAISRPDDAFLLSASWQEYLGYDALELGIFLHLNLIFPYW